MFKDISTAEIANVLKQSHEAFLLYRRVTGEAKASFLEASPPAGSLRHFDAKGDRPGVPPKNP